MRSFIVIQIVSCFVFYFVVGLTNMLLRCVVENRGFTLLATFVEKVGSMRMCVALSCCSAALSVKTTNKQ